MDSPNGILHEKGSVMTTIGHRRGIARLALPYHSPVANALNVAAWIGALGGLAIFVSLTVHDYWETWPWQHNVTLLDVFSPHVLGDSETWKFFLLLVIMLGSFAVQWLGIAFARRRGLPRFVVVPFALCLLLWGYAWYESSIATQKLRFTASGLWYPWGFVRWDQVERYTWSTSVPYRINGAARSFTDPVLVLTLKPAFLMPYTLSWVINSYSKVDVTKVLTRYVR